MHSLPIFVTLRGRPVILLGDGEAAGAKRRLLERAGAMIVGEEASAALAIVAVDNELAAQAAVARLKARGILVNAVDRPALCDFTLPAIIDRDPVLIAIGTGGASAGLAKALRQRIEALLPTRLGMLADALRQARAAIVGRWPDPAARRHAIDTGLAEGGPIDPLSEDAADHIDSWLSEHIEPEAGIVTIRPRSPDPDDLTLREARMLARADRVYHRPGAPAALLDRVRADAPRITCPHPPADLPPGLSIDLDI